MRVRTWHFYVTGAIGGLVGFILGEVVRGIVPPADSYGKLLPLACQFAAFGLAVGAALGMTEGILLKKFWRAVYGLFLGSVLGLLGGFVGGGTGQAIFSLLPIPEPPKPQGSDLAIALDSSGSMADRSGFFGLFGHSGSDPKGLRLKAARRLIEKLSPVDRVTIISFDNQSRVVQPLTRLDNAAARRAVIDALGRIGNHGGTNLNAGLSAALGELGRHVELGRQVGSARPQHVIFLTDGIGAFHPRVIQPAIDRGIRIYTIGLGNEVERRLLEDAIAKPTRGRYFPVADADKLWPTFEIIFEEAIRVDVASHDPDAGGDPRLRFILRVLGWLVIGGMIGFGQGARENTREDLWACSLGGALGGLLGGASFEPMSGALQMNDGLYARAVADVVVGAFIGGSIRLAQAYLVEKRTVRPTTLLEILPERATSLVAAPQAPPRVETPSSGFRGLVLKMKQTVEGSQGLRVIPNDKARPTPSTQPAITTPSTAMPSTATPEARRKPLSFYESRYKAVRPRAMAMAFRSGHYSVEEIARHFRVPPGRVKKAIAEHGSSAEE